MTDYLHPTEVEREVTKAFEAIRASDAEYEAPLVQKCLGLFATAQAETQRIMEIVNTRAALGQHKRALMINEASIREAEERLDELGAP